MARRQLTLDNTIAAELAGSEDTVLRELEDRLGCELFLRGNVLTLDGDDDDVRRAATMVDELVGLVERGHDLAPTTIETVTGAIAAAGEAGRDPRGRDLAPSVDQGGAEDGQPEALYVTRSAATRSRSGSGRPAPARRSSRSRCAVAALESRKVSRIILTRPAVEAGERLGFLPGDIQAKVDPYLRPLFDALYDMLDPEKVLTLLRPRRDRGRAARVHAREGATGHEPGADSGWLPCDRRAAGGRPGHRVRRPTHPCARRLPTGPQGGFRVRAQDGASALACGEHLWHVFTASDRRRGKPGRVMQTRDMIGNLRTAHQRRYELPLLSAPAEFPAREVAMDPYALGLLLGDGCLTTTTTPMFSTRDPELAIALEDALDGIELREKGEGDYVLRNREAGRGGVAMPTR